MFAVFCVAAGATVATSPPQPWGLQASLDAGQVVLDSAGPIAVRRFRARINEAAVSDLGAAGHRLWASACATRDDGGLACDALPVTARFSTELADGGLGYEQTGQVPLQYPLDIGAFQMCSPPGPCDEIVRVELELALGVGFSSATVHPWSLETTVQGMGEVEPQGAAVFLEELP